MTGLEVLARLLYYLFQGRVVVASGGVIVRIFLIFDNNSINNKATTLCLHTQVVVYMMYTSRKFQASTYLLFIFIIK